MNSRSKITYIIIFAVVVGAILAAYLNSSSHSQSIQQIGVAVSQSAIGTFEEIAVNATLAGKVGSGSAGNPPLIENGTPIYTNGLPTVVYVGADYCPYCAITRWGLILALMRFGNFTSLHYMASSSTDYSPNTPTFSFFNSSYSSNLIYFMSVETLTRNGTFLESPNTVENATFDKYDLNNKAIPANERGGIPFVDFGNKSVQTGAEVLPTLIQSMSYSEILSELGNSNSQVAQAIIGNANIFTAQICRIDNYTPKSVCEQPYIAKILEFP